MMTVCREDYATEPISFSATAQTCIAKKRRMRDFILTLRWGTPFPLKVLKIGPCSRRSTVVPYEYFRSDASSAPEVCDSVA